MSSAQPGAESKAELRRRVAACRAARTTADVDRARAAITKRVLARVEMEQWQCVAGYQAWRSEPTGPELLRGLHERGVVVLVPITLPDRDLEWVRWQQLQPTGTPRSLGRDGVATADLVLVPAFAVDRVGNRLGRGGGSYDRSLPRRGAGALVVATVFDEELVDRVEIDSWDVAVDAAVSPSGWHAFDRNTRVPRAG